MTGSKPGLSKLNSYLREMETRFKSKNPILNISSKKEIALLSFFPMAWINKDTRKHAYFILNAASGTNIDFQIQSWLRENKFYRGKGRPVSDEGWSTVQCLLHSSVNKWTQPRLSRPAGCHKWTGCVDTGQGTTNLGNWVPLTRQDVQVGNPIILGAGPVWVCILAQSLISCHIGKLNTVNLNFLISEFRIMRTLWSVAVCRTERGLCSSDKLKRQGYNSSLRSPNNILIWSHWETWGRLLTHTIGS